MYVVNKKLLVTVLVIANSGAYAQRPIGAGGQIQQIPSAPVEETPVPLLPLPQRHAAPAPVRNGTRFAVRTLRFTGATRFTEAQLLAVSHFRPGVSFTLTDLQAITANITNYYNQRGYFVARSYLPPQDITDGTVTIAVLEGKYAQVALRNQAHISDAVVLRIMSGLDRGDLIETGPLERRLLLVSDLPGVVTNATLSRGADVGTSDLAVAVTRGPRITGDVEADNWGNPYTGAARVGGTINLNEPLGIGDVLSFRTLESTDGGLDYGRLSYQAQVGDVTVGAAFTGFKYRLGKQFTDLDAHGTEAIGSVYASYPLIRSYNNNLYVSLDFDERAFDDSIDAAATSTHKQASVLIPGIQGNEHDGFGGGGWTDYAAYVSLGELHIHPPSARAEDALTGRTEGSYAKLAVNFSRLQTLSGPLSIYLSFRGQAASKNLDISEQMELGGAYGVRAYPEGEAYGDEGYIATIEPRLRLPVPRFVPGQLQLITFIDTGYVTVHRNAYDDANNGLTRSGAGVGLTWSVPNNFSASVGYAHMLGNRKATSYPDDSGELWLQLIKFF